MFTQSSRLKGFFMVTIGAALWGISGTMAQWLFQKNGVSVEWLVMMRLICSGALFLLIALAGRNRKKIGLIWTNKKDWLSLFVFGIFGMLGVQYTYFASVDTGNAAVATLLQYLAPLFITLYLILRFRSLPTFRDLTAIILALLGTFLLLTNGVIENFTVSGTSIVWGVLSGVALAFYTLYPGGLLKRWGSPIVIGWSMLIGGVCLGLFHPPWQVETGGWTLVTPFLIAFVILFGTLIAFYLYLGSLQFILPKESSLLGCTEPLAAVVTSLIWLHIPFGIFQVFGAGCVLLMVIILSLKKGTSKETAERI